MEPTRSDRVSSFLRCFAVQGSWNYRTLVAGGLANAMLPLLRRIYAGDPVRLEAAVSRHLEPFNAHPYLCAMAVTALARLEATEVSPEKITRFRTALRAPLGAVGDELVWAGWRPFCALLAIVLFALEGSPWVATLFFLLLYNVGHVYLRGWAFWRGWSAGFDVGRALQEAPWNGATRWLTVLNAFLVGAAVVLVAWRTPATALLRWEVVLALVAAAAVGYVRPGLGERVAATLLIAAPVLLLLLGG